MGESPMPPDAADQRLVSMGRIVAPFGVRGWVKAQAWTETPEELLGFRDWLLAWPDGRQRRARLLEGRVHGKGLVLRFESVDDRDAAAALARAEMQIERQALPAPAAGEYYRDDLLGFEVVNLQGERLGSVDHFVDTPGNAVMVVKGALERWLPLVPRHLKQVDLASRRLLVDWDVDF